MTFRAAEFRVTVAALALLPFTSASTRAQMPPPSPPEFPARVDMVTVEVTVLDRAGQPVPGLAMEAFSLYEDGVRQEIAGFQAIDVRPGAAAVEPATGGTAGGATEDASPPWTYVLAIDDLHLTPSQATDVRKATSAFFDSVPAGARVVLIATAARFVEDQRIPGGRASLEARLRTIRGSLSVTRGDELISDEEAYEIHVRHNLVVEDIVTRRIVRLELGEDLEKREDPYWERTGMLRAVTETRGRAGKRYYLMTLRAQTTWASSETPCGGSRAPGGGARSSSRRGVSCASPSSRSSRTWRGPRSSPTSG